MRRIHTIRLLFIFWVYLGSGWADGEGGGGLVCEKKEGEREREIHIYI